MRLQQTVHKHVRAIACEFTLVAASLKIMRDIVFVVVLVVVLVHGSPVVYIHVSNPLRAKHSAIMARPRCNLFFTASVVLETCSAIRSTDKPPR